MQRDRPPSLSEVILRRPATALALIAAACASTPNPAARQTLEATVHVAPPSGERETDRASILAALEEVRPGDTIQFAPGTYLVGEIIHVTVPRVTVRGHLEGTTLRGCNPEEFPQHATEMAELFTAVVQCNGLDMAGGHQRVLDLTFEYAWHALVLGGMECIEDRGCVPVLEPVRSRSGGYLVEGNTFRNLVNGVRTLGEWTEPAVIRGNRFLNTFHAAVVHGSTVHILDNEISVPEPDQVPSSAHPGEALSVSATDLNAELPLRCVGNIIAGNRIEGHTDGISIALFRRGLTCRDNAIRNNTIRVARVAVPASWAGVTVTGDSSVVGVPLALVGSGEAYGELPISPEDTAPPSRLEGTIVEGNSIVGAEGLGIEVYRASGSRIAGNTITAVRRRDPFPGVTVNSTDPARAGWREANGSGIWISPGSDGNEILGNTFEEIAGAAIVLEGDSNRVELRSASDEVRDRGSANRVAAPDHRGDAALENDRAKGEAPRPGSTRGDTIRYSLLPAGSASGERLVWTDPATVWHSRLHFRGTQLETRVDLDSAGLPVRTEIAGMQPGSVPLPWEERFAMRRDTAAWSTPATEGSDVVRGSAFYVPARYRSSFALHLLAPALLRRPDGALRLLPDGEARLEALERRTITAGGRYRTVRLHAIHGLDFAPEYVWLDEDGSLFADDLSILAGWEAAFPELDAAATAALVRQAWQAYGELIPPAWERPLVIRGARLFDPESRSLRDRMTVLIRDNRIVAVGPDGTIEIPETAEVIDATGRTVLPGLWDMHVHFNDDFVEEMEVPLFVAAGVTTVRDLGSRTDFMRSIRRRSESGRALAPRILPALIMYGPGEWPLGVGVGTPEEARAAVDRFAALGYVQVKLYNPVPPELVPVIIDRARSHGMRVSGHIPNGMTARQAIESGFDEIQHLFYARIGAAQTGGLTPDDDLGARMAAVRVGTDEWEEFVRLLRSHDVVVDPTLAVVEESVGDRPPVWLGKVLDRFPAQAGRAALHNVGPASPPPMLRERWDDIVANGLDLVRALHEAGVRIVAGTDGPIGGFALHRELELYVEAGIPAPDVLALATLGAARVMGLDDELGSIERGKLADLIIIDGDPTTNMSDIRRVVTVVMDGNVYDPAAIYRAVGIRPCCGLREDAR